MGRGAKQQSSHSAPGVHVRGCSERVVLAEYRLTDSTSPLEMVLRCSEQGLDSGSRFRESCSRQGSQPRIQEGLGLAGYGQ